MAIQRGREKDKENARELFGFCTLQIYICVLFLPTVQLAHVAPAVNRQPGYRWGTRRSVVSYHKNIFHLPEIFYNDSGIVLKIN